MTLQDARNVQTPSTITAQISLSLPTDALDERAVWRALAAQMVFSQQEMIREALQSRPEGESVDDAVLNLVKRLERYLQGGLLSRF